MNSRVGLSRVSLVSFILLVVIIAAVALGSAMFGFLGRSPPTTNTTQISTTTSNKLTTITTIKTSTTTTSSVTLKLPEIRTYMANIFDLFGNFSTMTVSITNSSSSASFNFTSTEIVTFSVANITSSGGNRTAAVGFNYNHTSVINGVRSSYANVSLAFLQLTKSSQVPNFTLVDSSDTIYFQQAAQVVGNSLIAPFSYIMGVGLPLKSSQYSSSQSGLAQQTFNNFELPETIYSVSYAKGTVASATVGDYPPASLLLVAYDSGAGWTYRLTGAQSG